MSYLLKDPLATVDYTVDWRADYLGETDNLASSIWSVEPDEPGGVQVAVDSFTLAEAKVSVSGGIGGRIYRLTNRVQTAAGLEDRRSIAIRVEAR